MKLIIDIPKITYEATKDLGRLAICNDNEIAEWIIKGVPLEQEPFINKSCVSSGVCEHDKNKVLDEIRAEIEQKLEQEEFARSVFRHEEKDYTKAEQCTGSILAYMDVRKMFDKYKTESEG